MIDNFLSQAHTVIKNAQKILIITPQNWSGDQIASLFAMNKVINFLKKEVTVIAQNEIPKSFSFLGDQSFIQKDLIEKGDFVISISTKKSKVDRIKYTINEDSVDIFVSPVMDGSFNADDVQFQQSIEGFDAILLLGVDTWDDLGGFFVQHPEIFSMGTTINFSVSPQNNYLGKINCVDFSKSSLSELVLAFIEKDPQVKEALDANMAKILLAGIISATGSFLEKNTSPNAFHAASKLQKIGGDHSEIIENLFKMKTLSTLKMWGKILANVDVDPIHKISWSSINRTDLAFLETKKEDIDNIATDLLRHTNQSELSILFLEDETGCTIQLRISNEGIAQTELNKFLGNAGKIVPFGLDFFIPKKSLVEVEFEFLKLLLFFQKKRLGISKEIELQRIQIEFEVPRKPIEKAHSTENPEIPFELKTKDLPEQKPEETQKPKEEKKELPKEEDVLPQWLKK